MLLAQGRLAACDLNRRPSAIDDPDRAAVSTGTPKSLAGSAGWTALGDIVGRADRPVMTDCPRADDRRGAVLGAGPGRGTLAPRSLSGSAQEGRSPDVVP